MHQLPKTASFHFHRQEPIYRNVNFVLVDVSCPAYLFVLFTMIEMSSCVKKGLNTFIGSDPTILTFIPKYLVKGNFWTVFGSFSIHLPLLFLLERLLLVVGSQGMCFLGHHWCFFVCNQPVFLLSELALKVC